MCQKLIQNYKPITNSFCFFLALYLSRKLQEDTGSLFWTPVLLVTILLVTYRVELLYLEIVSAEITQITITVHLSHDNKGVTEVNRDKTTNSVRNCLPS